MKKQVEVFYCDDCGSKIDKGFYFDLENSFYLKNGEQQDLYFISPEGKEQVKFNICLNCLKLIIIKFEEESGKK